MPKRPTIVTLAAALLIISATFSNKASASTNSSTPSFQSISVRDTDAKELKAGKRKKEFQGAGTVTAVSGSIVTVLGNDHTMYVVDAGGASIKKGVGTKAELTDIRSGDRLFVRGEVIGSEAAEDELFD